MSEQRLTQCPHCKASFKVSEEQLNAANGRVRCGACMNIFDAIAYSLSENGSTQKSKPASETDELEDELFLSEDSNEIEEVSDELFADNPDEDLNDPGYSGSSDNSDEFSTSFLELDSADASAPYSTSFRDVDNDLITDVNDEAIDESWTQDILDDIKDERKQNRGKNKTRVEPVFSETIETEPNPQENEADAGETFTSADSAISEARQYRHVEFHYDQDKQRHWFVSFLFIIANIALVMALLAQAVWFHYEKLAKYPKVKEYYQLVCEHLSCTLPKLEDISKVKSSNLVVRSHPTQRKALIIDTVIVNEASYNQAFPDLALYFSDINKNVVAQRLFKPENYLTGDLATWHEMPSQQPIHISLEIVDPGKQAVNYNLEFFSPAE